MRPVLLAIAIVAIPWMTAIANTTAKVEQGLLQGTVEDGLTVYRGIPFAAPPTGELRWRPPQPALLGKVCAARTSSRRNACSVRRQASRQR